MRIRSMRFVELVVMVALLWAVCWFFVWWVKTPSVRSSPSSSPIPAEPRVGLLHEKQANRTKRKVPVYIVEEHHEVIKYWYGAAKQGYLPKKGNVLLHIDGHSDGATPPNWKLGPLFRYPSSSRDLNNMMQENDVFIISSALTGFISRYIWVWPAWNTEGSEGQHHKKYASMNIRYGSMHVEDTRTGRNVVELCICASSKEFGFENHCMRTKSSDGENPEGAPIEEAQCNFKMAGLIETVSEMEAISRIKSGTWITADDNVLLDIDEDFYGVEPVVEQLYKTGVDQEKTDLISDWVKKLVCIPNARVEKQADSFYNYLIQTIVNFKIFCSVSAKAKKSICSTAHRMTSTLMKLRGHFMNNLKERNLKRYLCDRTESEEALKELISEFSRMSIKQLKAFAEVGICLNESPKSTAFRYVNNMRVCYGYNTPNQTSVMFYVPSMLEIEQRTDNLKDILKQKQFVPNAVTVCRSSRDGYTPKKYLRKIETDIIDVLREAFPDILEDSFYYDEDLLGGPFGWYKRH